MMIIIMYKVGVILYDLCRIHTQRHLSNLIYVFVV